MGDLRARGVPTALTRTSKSLVTAAVFVAIVGVGWFVSANKPGGAVQEYELAKSVPDKKAFIDKYKSEPVPEKQDLVARSRMELAYGAAKDKDFRKARTLMLETAREYKGVPTPDYTWGSLQDQARVQAAICLLAEGKVDEGKRELLGFIKENPHSPLIHHAYKRVLRANRQKPDPNEQKVFEDALALQEKEIRKRQADCGPKLLHYLLDESVSLDDLRSECATDETGTTLANLSNVLNKYGYVTEGLEVNGQDFDRLNAPFVWLTGGHYVLVTKKAQGIIAYYDPMADRVLSIGQPDIQSIDFRAIVLTLQESKRS